MVSPARWAGRPRWPKVKTLEGGGSSPPPSAVRGIMSWIRDHFHNLVFPAFLAAGKRTTEIGPPLDVQASPHAPKHLPTELKKLWTLCQDHKMAWGTDTREVNKYGGTSQHRKHAKLHTKVLRNSLQSALAAMRTEKCSKLFLGGRDVWAYVVLCERKRIPYLFVPELSRTVSSHPNVKSFLEARGFTGNELFLDTGFAGSIPKNLAEHFGRSFKFRLMSQYALAAHVEWKTTTKIESDGEETLVLNAFKSGTFSGWDRPSKPYREVPKFLKQPNQLFPNRVRARDEALETEYLAKYWKTGTISRTFGDAAEGEEPEEVPGSVVQFFSDRENIQRAALLTSQLWRGQAIA